ncbi:MAG: hypothetical protein IJB68_05295 [Ruminococcus sp.]|nr:hypothetical protein [Ruminococcus sp.]
MKKQVYICSPLLGNTGKNIAKADRYRQYAIDCGVSPVSIHEDYRVVDWNNQRQVQLALENALTKIWCSDELWVMGTEITDRMREEIEFCNEFNITVRYISNTQFKQGIRPED